MQLLLALKIPVKAEGNQVLQIVPTRTFFHFVGQDTNHKLLLCKDAFVSLLVLFPLNHFLIQSFQFGILLFTLFIYMIFLFCYTTLIFFMIFMFHILNYIR